MKIEKPKESEIKNMRAEFESFAPGSFDKLFEGKVLLAVRGNWTEIVLANSETAEMALKMAGAAGDKSAAGAPTAPPEESDQKTPYAIGTTIGEIKDGWFRLGLGGASLLGPIAQNRYAIVNEKAVSLFLYGRDIIGPSIIEYKAKKGNHILVLNEKRECLGLGKLVEEPKNTSHTAIKNSRDLGWYIREGY
ncbi:MAG: hypothetical protein PHH26_08915 [Candidatus Thermoplasmatota archaeon]|nr:hypothetical protein [Candidatus Thermoplasmatota archaeon]